MRSLLLAATLAALGSVGLRAQDTLQFYATFVGPDGRPLTQITAADIDVRENGMSAQVVRVDKVDWPVKVELLLDNGAGIGPDNLLVLRTALEGFVDWLPEGVEASVITLAPQPRTLVRPTTDKQALRAGAGLLTPDGGAGRFVEGLMEAATRINRTRGDKDGGRYFPVIVALGSTAAQGRTPVERQVEEMLERMARHAATVHVIMLTSTSQGLTGGANQTQVGIAVSELTGGVYENLSAASRIATLLPELAQRIGDSHARQQQQFRVTWRRPAGATGETGRVTVGARGAARAQLSLDGHLP
ncbi:MAG: VWA domain-containing protein [Vicinamibacterales bacterium]